jgi:TolB-like protein
MYSSGMLAPLLALALAAPTRLAVLPIVAGEGVSDKTAAALTEALAAEVRRRSGGEVITQREINTVLSLERQKAMMGCATDSCMAELGGALGVSELVNGDVARVGESLLVHFRLVDVGKVRVIAQADRRLRKGTLDDILDQLPAMAAELFPDAAAPPLAAGGDRPRPAGQAAGDGAQQGVVPGPKPATTSKPLPPPWVEEPEKVESEALEALTLWEDGSGNTIAMNATKLEDLFLAGTARKMHRVRVGGGYLNGGEGTGDKSFWEPRAGGHASFEFKPDEAKLSCGRKEIPFKRVPALEARKILARAELLAPRWRRIPHLLARDDQGTYFLVDGARGPGGEPADPPDFRLYVGKKGALARVELEDAIRDDAGLVFLTSGGRLVARQQGRKYAVEWGAGATRVALTWLDPADHGPLIYRELGVYAGQALGTPCDGRF